METVVLEAVTPETVSALAELAHEIWFEYWPSLIGADQTSYMVDRFQSLPAIERDMRDHAYEYWFVRAVDDGRIVDIREVMSSPRPTDSLSPRSIFWHRNAESILRAPWSPSMSDFAASAASLPCISPSTRVTTWAFAHIVATASLLSMPSRPISVKGSSWTITSWRSA